MLIINEVLGNIISDEKWKKLFTGMSHNNQVKTIMITHRESERSRFFKKIPEINEELGINLKRGTVLHNGDVLYYRVGEKMFVVRIEPEKVMVFHFVGKLNADELLKAAVKLGHAIGNQHWEMRVEGNKVIVPLTLDQKVMESVIKTHKIPGIRYDFEYTEKQISNEKDSRLDNIPHHYFHQH